MDVFDSRTPIRPLVRGRRVEAGPRQGGAEALGKSRVLEAASTRRLISPSVKLISLVLIALSSIPAKRHVLELGLQIAVPSHA